MQTADIIDPRLFKILRCPTSGLSLGIEGDELVSSDGSRRYPVVSGIPCLIPDSAEPTHTGYRDLVDDNRKQLDEYAEINEKDVANFIQAMIVATCGNLFRRAQLKGVYPIPDFPTVFCGPNILDIGCNWGRWSIAGAKAGHRIIGIDVHLKSLLSAQWLSRKLTPENEPFFVLADARYMPFAPESFGGVFSYSVIQHFSKSTAAAILAEIKRVMRPEATSVIQMPNKAGARYRMAFRDQESSEGSEFDVRYYSIPELLSLFTQKIGKSDWHVDCFFGLNVHACDKNFVPLSKRWIVDLAECFLWASKKYPPIGKFCDSVFLTSKKS